MSEGKKRRRRIDPLVLRATLEELKNSKDGEVLMKLYELRAYDGKSVNLKELKSQLDVKNVGYVIKKLVKAKLVKQAKSLVGNQKYVTLTEKGCLIAEELAKELGKVKSEIIDENKVVKNNHAFSCG